VIRRIFIAATRQNVGKTTVAVGLTVAMSHMTPRIGFIKPVGQRSIEYHGVRADEDAVLMQEIFGSQASLRDMSPVTIGKGFTREYIDSRDNFDLQEQILGAFSRVAAESDLVVIEGTGHAGVGAVLGLSNARVARLLRSKVLLVAEGGIGQPIDEIALNHSLFTTEGVELAGVVLNKVLPSKLQEVRSYVGRDLSYRGIPLCGVIPLQEGLRAPCMRHLVEEINARVLCGTQYLENLFHQIIVGAMTPHNALKYMRRGVLLITPGDREDLILAATSSHLVMRKESSHISGILLTGGLEPSETILDIVKQCAIPVLMVDKDSYTAASKVHDLVAKVRPYEKKKIVIMKQLISEFVDVKAIFDAMT